MIANDTGAHMESVGHHEKATHAYGPREAAQPGIGSHLVVESLVSALPKVVLGLALGAVISVGLLTLLRMAMPPLATYRSGVTITMASGAEGRYPNGAKFAISDLRSPLVLAEVYKKNKLETYDILLDDFIGMISVSPYSPGYQSAVDRFQTRLSNKTLTFEERKAIEDDFRNTINSLNASGMQVALTVPDTGKIPASLATKIVDDIPAKWAEIYVERLGVANMPLPTSGVDIVDAQLLGLLDYPLAYDYLVSRVGIVLDQIQNLKEFSGSTTFVSAKSGKSIDDLQRILASMAEFKLTLGLRPLVDGGLSRDPVATVAIYDNLTKNLELDSVSQREYSRRVGGVLQDYASRVGDPTVAPLGSSLSGQSGGGTVVTLGQSIDGGLVDKVAQLSNRPAEFAFEKDLLEKKLDYENAGVSFDDKKLRMTNRRNAILNNSLDPAARATMEEKFNVNLADVATTLNQIWGDVLQMTDEVNLKRFNNDKVLYNLSNLSDNVRVERPTVFSTNNVLIALVITLFCAMAGLLYSLWKQFFRPSHV